MIFVFEWICYLCVSCEFLLKFPSFWKRQFTEIRLLSKISMQLLFVKFLFILYDVPTMWFTIFYFYFFIILLGWLVVPFMCWTTACHPGIKKKRWANPKTSPVGTLGATIQMWRKSPVKLIFFYYYLSFLFLKENIILLSTIYRCQNIVWPYNIIFIDYNIYI